MKYLLINKGKDTLTYTHVLSSAIGMKKNGFLNNNHQLDVDRLVVTRAEVGKSIVMRRFHARGRGRSAQIEKWFSHIKIVVAERAQVAAPETSAQEAA